jgi:hypothetical protein
MFRTTLLLFAAGALGGLTCSVLIWALGEFGVTAAAGVAMAPSLSAAWLYPRIVWGGIWGAVFLLRVPGGGWLKRGLLLSLAPSAAALLWFLPQAGAGLFALDRGTLAPLFVLLVNASWGLTAAFALKQAGHSA